MKKKTKTLIFILIIFAVVLGGLFGVYYFFLADKINKDSAISDGGVGIKSILDNFFPSPVAPAAGEIAAPADTFDGADADAPAPRLRQISSFPVAGGIAFENGDGETFIRFISRETGHIYETAASSLTQERISNTTIPRIQRALFAPSGEELIIQYLDEDSEQIESFYALIEMDEEALQKESGSLAGTFLPKGIKELVLSESGEKIFYLAVSGGGVVGIVSGMDGSKKTQIFDSPLSEWLLEWQTDDTIALTTKPSSNISGFLYFLNSKTEKFDKIISASDGLTASVSPDGKLVLFERGVGGVRILSALDIKTGEEADMPLWTLPEKCVWSDINSAVAYCGIPSAPPAGKTPDDWYQGLESFSDSVWLINTETGTTDLVIEPFDEKRVNLDIVNPSLSPDEDYLLFINKEDSALWSLEL
jgi:hypothetical protein